MNITFEWMDYWISNKFNKSSNQYTRRIKHFSYVILRLGAMQSKKDHKILDPGLLFKASDIILNNFFPSLQSSSLQFHSEQQRKVHFYFFYSL